MNDMTATEVVMRQAAYRYKMDALSRQLNDTIQAMRDYGLIASTGDELCPSTTPGVKIVTTRLNTPGLGIHPFRRVPIAGVRLTLFGEPSGYWTKLKIRTIYSTDQSPAAARSRASLMIGEKAVKILSDEDIKDFLDTRDPLDVEWVNDDKDLTPNSE